MYSVDSVKFFMKFTLEHLTNLGIEELMIHYNSIK